MIFSLTDKVDPSKLVKDYRVGQHIPLEKFNLEKTKFNAIKNNYTKFIYVREPMERLASCYNDKMIVREGYTVCTVL